MCAKSATSSSKLPRKARPLVTHLRERVHEEGAIYVKSRVIAEELSLSSKEIGSYMKRLAETDTGPAVEGWSYTNGTTWYVSRE